VADTTISGIRVARELDKVVAVRRPARRHRLGSIVRHLRYLVRAGRLPGSVCGGTCLGRRRLAQCVPNSLQGGISVVELFLWQLDAAFGG
jgi:hypothetical protein